MLGSMLRTLIPSPIRAGLRPIVRAIRGRFASTPFERHAPRWWRYVQLLLAGSRSHAFLDRRWVPATLTLLPRRLREPVALRLLGLSPHYWVYQWTNRYPKAATRSQILHAEFERNARSREELCDKLLRRYLSPGSTVLDFGCGPGFLAKSASRYAGKVIAVDVSRGVLACARVLNDAANLDYRRCGTSGLTGVAEASIDLIYTFAVFQHVRKDDAVAIFAEFALVLKPGGRLVSHHILKEASDDRVPDPSVGDWVQRRVMLRMVYYTPAELTAILTAAGFRDVTIQRVNDIAELDDDIGHEHLVVCRR